MRQQILLAAITILALSSCTDRKSSESVNLAFRHAATASSSYDYNLTAQLVTDGMDCKGEPAWMKVSTAAGELPRREKEWTVDAGPYSGNVLQGPDNFIEYEWSRQSFTAGCIRIVGTLVCQEDADGWSIECSAGRGTLVKVGGLSGQGLPGTPRKPVTITDPNKQSEGTLCLSRALRLEIPLEGAEDFNRFRIEFKQQGGISWEIKSVDFTLGKSFGTSKDTGPYESEESRGFNVLPAEVFTSAWMSANDSPQWVCVDLGESKRFSRVEIDWLHWADRSWIETSDDGTAWKKVSGRGKGRYVRVCMEGADTSGHFAISEMRIVGRGDASPASPHGLTWKLARASEVNSPGEDISSGSYDDSGWMPAEVPGTVLYSYISAGAVPDPAIADNNNQISESYFNSDFWYRWETSLKASGTVGKRTLLTFDGINWKAEVFMNGKRLGQIDGAFKRGVFDVTDIAGEDNVVAVHVIKPAHYGAVKEKNAESPDFNGGQLGADNPTFHASVGWDWIPTVRGRETGIWNDVHFDFVDDVIISNPYVKTTLAEKDTLASVTLAVDLQNLSSETVGGVLEGTLDTIRFSRRITLGPSQKETIAFRPEEYPQLKDLSIPLWWPVGYGNPTLHPATYKFVQDGVVRDSSESRHDLFYLAGIREFTYKDVKTDLKMYINGHRFFPKGGNWGFSEFNLRYGKDEYDTAVRLHKEMNLNMIRNWVGQTGDDEFYEACDKYGVVVWQDFWLANPADGPDPDDEDMFMDNAEDLVGRIRHHPSIGLYCGRNEGYPPASLNARLVNAVAHLHGDIAYIPSSADDGVSGHGPYRAVEPDSYFSMPALKFHSERGMPAIMNYGSLMKTMTARHIWPSDDVWGQHDFTRTGAQGDTAFVGMVRRRYGEKALDSAETFAKYAQLVNYDGYRAMYEANNVERKGLLIWMSHSCWPSLAWQTYDYWFDKTAAFKGVQKACEPVHVQLNPVRKTVAVVNSLRRHWKGLEVSVRLSGVDGTLKYSKTASLDIGEDMTVDAIDISDVPDGPVLVELTLKDADGNVLSENHYLRNFSRGKDSGDYRSMIESKGLADTAAWYEITL